MSAPLEERVLGDHGRGLANQRLACKRHNSHRQRDRAKMRSREAYRTGERSALHRCWGWPSSAGSWTRRPTRGCDGRRPTRTTCSTARPDTRQQGNRTAMTAMSQHALGEAAVTQKCRQAAGNTAFMDQTFNGQADNQTPEGSCKTEEHRRLQQRERTSIL